MEFKKLEIEGVYEIFLKSIEDERGFFMRTYDSKIFKRYKIDRQWVNQNHSKSIRPGTIRGLHLQLPPFSEAKLVRCIVGEIIDVFVDLRLGSNTFGRWGKSLLSDKNRKMIFLPEGFAHGFCSISETSEIVYQVSNFYSKKHEIGLAWNDKDVGIKWPELDFTISEKDRKNLTLKDFKKNYGGINI